MGRNLINRRTSWSKQVKRFSNSKISKTDSDMTLSEAMQNNPNIMIVKPDNGGHTFVLSDYFKKHPENILGTVVTHNPNTGRELTDAWGKPKPEVRGSLSDAMQRINVPVAMRYNHVSAVNSPQSVEIVEIKAKQEKKYEKAIRKTVFETEKHPNRHTCENGLKCLADSIKEFNTNVEYKDKDGKTRYYTISEEEIQIWVTYQVNKGLYNREQILETDWRKYFLPKIDTPQYLDWFERDLVGYDGRDFIPTPIFYAGNIYENIKTLNKNEAAIISMIGKEGFEAQLQRMEAAKPKPLLITDDETQKLRLSPFDKIWHDIKIAELADGTILSDDAEKDVVEAFKWSYMANLPKTAFKDGKYSTDAYDIRRYWIDKEAFPRGTDEVEKTTKKRITALIGEKLFDKFLVEALTREDKAKIAALWNAKRNNFKEIEHWKIPVGFTINSRFKGGELKPRSAQREGVAFLNYRGTGIVAYDVGVGKTMTAILAVQDMMEKGLCKRPMIVVPNGVYHKWKGEINGVIAKEDIFKGGKKANDFKTSKERDENRIAKKGDLIAEGILPHVPINDYFNLGAEYLDSAVDDPKAKNKIAKAVPSYSITMVTYEGLEKIGFDTKTEGTLLTRLTESLGQGESGRAAALQEKAAEGWIDNALKNTEVNIEDMGIDCIIVDEAHNFRNLFMEVKGDIGEDGEREKKNFLSGNSSAPSARAVKLFMLNSYIQSKHNRRNTIGLTATPFTNRATEIYSMMALYDYEGLKDYDAYNLAQFCTTFIDETYEASWTTGGKFEMKPVIRGYNNLPILQSLVFRAINYKTGEEANIQRPTKIILPLTRDDKGIPLSLEHVAETRLKPTALQMEWLTEIFKFGSRDNWKNSKLAAYYPKNDKGDIDGRILIALNAARVVTLSPYALKLGGSPEYTPESITPQQFIESSPKLKYVTECMRTVKQYHEARGTDVSGQVIYSDRGTEWFYHIKTYLIENLGYKDYEVQLYTGEVSKDKRENIKKDFLNGRCKVIIGTSTMKEGVDLQTYGTVIYNCYLDWNPTDHHQLQGRIWRFGNTYSHVRIVVPLIENSSDIFTWQKLSEKMSRLNSIWTRANQTKMFEEKELDAEELKKSLINDPAELARTEIEEEVVELNSLKSVVQGDLGELQKAKSYSSKFGNLDSTLREYALQAKTNPRSSWDKKPEQIQKVKDMEYRDDDIKSIYRIVRAYAELQDYYGRIRLRDAVEEHQKALKKMKDIEERILSRKGLSIQDDISPIITEMQGEYNKLLEQETKVKSDEYFNEKFERIAAEKAEMEKRSKPTEQRVNEFARLNYLLDCKFQVHACDIYGRVSEINTGKTVQAIEQPKVVLKTDDAPQPVILKKGTLKTPKADIFQDYPLVKLFMPRHQQLVVAEYEEERDAVLQDVEAMLSKLPQVREVTASIELMERARHIPDKNYYTVDHLKVYVHYFLGMSDWFITNYDKDDDLFWGYVILNADAQMAEYGAISRKELFDMGIMVNKVGGLISKGFKQGIELDFYWTPKYVWEAKLSVNGSFSSGYMRLESAIESGLDTEGYGKKAISEKLSENDIRSIIEDYNSLDTFQEKDKFLSDLNRNGHKGFYVKNQKLMFDSRMLGKEKQKITFRFKVGDTALFSNDRGEEYEGKTAKVLEILDKGYLTEIDGEQVEVSELDLKPIAVSPIAKVKERVKNVKSDTPSVETKIYIQYPKGSADEFIDFIKLQNPLLKYSTYNNLIEKKTKTFSEAISFIQNFPIESNCSIVIYTLKKIDIKDLDISWQSQGVQYLGMNDNVDFMAFVEKISNYLSDIFKIEIDLKGKLLTPSVETPKPEIKNPKSDTPSVETPNQNQKSNYATYEVVKYDDIVNELPYKGEKKYNWVLVEKNGSNILRAIKFGMTKSDLSTALEIANKQPKDLSKIDETTGFESIYLKGISQYDAFDILSKMYALVRQNRDSTYSFNNKTTNYFKTIDSLTDRDKRVLLFHADKFKYSIDLIGLSDIENPKSATPSVEPPKNKPIELKLIEGVHATTTEKDAIRQMIEKGYTKAHTKKKSYEILEMTDTTVKVKVGSYDVWTIGDVAKWQFDTMVFHYAGDLNETIERQRTKLRMLNDEHSRILNELTKKYPGKMGGISEEGRQTQEYFTAKLNYDRSFRVLREFNAKYKAKRKEYNIKTDYSTANLPKPNEADELKQSRLEAIEGLELLLSMTDSKSRKEELKDAIDGLKLLIELS